MKTIMKVTWATPDEMFNYLFYSIITKKTRKYFEKDSENLSELEALNEISNKRK